MAEPRDPSLDDAIDIMVASGTPDEQFARAPRLPTTLLDAFSIALSTIGAVAREPDPRVERDLSQVDAIAAASGVMTAPVSQRARWWQSLSGPAVTVDGEAAAAVLPSGVGAVSVEGGTRARTRFSGVKAAIDTVVITSPLPPNASWRSLVWWSVRHRRMQLGSLILLSLIGGVLGLLLPIATWALFGYAVPLGDGVLAVGILIAFALGGAGGALLLAARNISLVQIRDASDARLSSGIMAHLLRLPMPFFRQMSAGEVLNRAMSVETARSTVQTVTLALVLTSAFGLVNLVFLFVIDFMLGIVMSLAIGVIVFLVTLSRRHVIPLTQQWLREQSAFESNVMSLAEAVVPIRVAGAEARALARWTRLAAPAVTTLGRRTTAVFSSEPMLVGGPIAINAVLVYAVVADRGGFTAAAFMAAYAAVLQLTVAAGLLTQNLSILGELAPTLQRMEPITSSAVERPGPTQRPGPLRGHIQLSNVVFGYSTDQPPLVNGLSINVEPGEFVAIVGPSGSGKSTVMRLLLGFETPWSGVVSYDGKDLSELDVTAVRRQMGTVLQSSVPFGSTYRECICGPLQIDDDLLWQVIRESGLEREVRTHGLDAPIGDRGGEISGGQRQRLMIARALASDPRVILLDEATSALDNVTQEIVMQSILGRPVTRIAIAHRLNTIERADRVLVVVGGQIVEDGTPADLLASGGHFARLAKRQEF
jgi:ABC-type bacteriocin/lantibiotic exporter with double-glycine peptidase domain